MRDRTAEVDRRGARGDMTGNKIQDGESSNISHQTHGWQQPVMDLYEKIAQARDNTDFQDNALKAGIHYLVAHQVGREQ